MHKMQLVMWVALATAVAIPVYFWRRSKDVFSGLNAFVTERQFSARPSSPIALFVGKDPPEGLHYYAGYDGSLRPNTPVTLLLFRRTESVMVQGVPMQTSTIYVGAYLPPTVKVDGSWLKAWEDRAARRRDKVVYAARVAEGGVVIVWQGAPTRAHVTEQLEALGRSLPAT